MIEKIYNLLPPKWKEQTRLKWLQENDEAIRTFYDRLKKPKLSDFKFFYIVWGVPLDELMAEIEFKTIKRTKQKKSDTRYMMQVVDFMNTENKQTEIPL